MSVAKSKLEFNRRLLMSGTEIDAQKNYVKSIAAKNDES